MGHLHRCWPLLVALMVMAGSPVYAEDSTAHVPERSTTLTVSVSTPWQGVGELAWEQRLFQGFSTVVVAGLGGAALTEGATEYRTLFEVGGQLRYTAVGDFDDGLGFALDGRYLRARVDEEGSEGRGFALGPQLFWKWVFWSGLTLDVHLGASWVWATLHNPGLSAPVERGDLQATGGVGLGWSFGG